MHKALFFGKKNEKHNGPFQNCVVRVVHHKFYIEDLFDCVTA